METQMYKKSISIIEELKSEKTFNESVACTGLTLGFLGITKVFGLRSSVRR